MSFYQLFVSIHIMTINLSFYELIFRKSNCNVCARVIGAESTKLLKVHLLSSPHKTDLIGCILHGKFTL